MASSVLTMSENEGRPFFGYEIEWLFWNRRTSYQLGLFHEHRLSENLYLLAEFAYSRRGLDGHTSFLFDEVDYLIKMDYLQVPLALKLRLPISEKAGLGLYSGGYAALAVNGVRTSRIDGIEERIDLSNIRTFDFGYLIGLGYDAIIRGRRISFDIRYERGLVNVMNKMAGFAAVSDGGEVVKHQAIVMLVGVGLP